MNSWGLLCCDGIMRGSLRLKLALSVFLVLLCGAVSVSHAQEGSNWLKILEKEGTSSLTLSSAEELNNFLVRNYTELTPDERDLLQKALQARQINDGQGSFLFQPTVKQVEVVGQVLEGFFSVLWPTFDKNGQALSPGVLGHLASWTDGVLESPQPVTAPQMIASLNPTQKVLAQVGVKAFQDLPLGTEMLGGLGGGVILTYWASVRNLAYALLTIVLVVFGFMIMLRQNLEPRVVMTISNALPRIATALVLITFSFAISGLIIDVGRVADGVLKGVNPSTQGKNHSIWSLLFEFTDAGLTNMSATMKSTAYIWKFPEETLDRNFSTWRCDYNPQCSGGACIYRKDYKDPTHPGSIQACPPFSCSLGPFGTGGKYYNCTLVVNAKERKVITWPGGPEFTYLPVIAFPLIDPNDVPPGACRQKAGGSGDPELYPNPSCVGCADGIPNNDIAYIGKPCCNEGMAECHDAQEIPWRAPFPRNSGNILELWINKLIILIIGALINLLFFLTLLQTIFALLFKMISCFAMWFVLAIVSPLVFMWAAIPGQEDTAGTWAKNLLANALAFPVVNFVINLALALATFYKGGAILGDYPSILFIGNPNTSAMLVPFGIILITPSIPDMLKDIIGVKGGKGAGAPDMGKQVKKLPIIGGLVG